MCDEFERDVSTNGMSGHLGSLLEGDEVAWWAVLK